MHTIAFTGHRPQDLPKDMGYQTFAEALDALGVSKRTDLRFVVGGALGTDSWAATYAITHGIDFDLVLPFKPEVMGRFWSEVDRVCLQTAIHCADSYRVIHEGTYAPEFYQRRNEAMVDKADHVFALWSGKPRGGTTNCIRYALTSGKPVYNLWPLDGKLRPVTSL